MRTSSLSRVAALVVALSAAGPLIRAARAQQIVVGIIDVQRILAESEEGKKEIARIKGIQDEKLGHLKQMEADVQKLKDKLTDLGFSISEDERTRLQRQIEDKMIEGERYRKDADREINAQFEDVFAAFEKKIYPVIEKVGAEKNILVILNKQTPGLVWAQKSVDITADVIEQFNRMSASGRGK